MTGLSMIVARRFLSAMFTFFTSPLSHRIFAIDTNPEKFAQAMDWGATETLNPKDYDKPIQQVLIGLTEWGVEYT